MNKTTDTNAEAEARMDAFIAKRDAADNIEALIAYAATADIGGDPLVTDLVAALIVERDRANAAEAELAARDAPPAPTSDQREARAWWEGVNDQWKNRPIGSRLLETANPYLGRGQYLGPRPTPTPSPAPPTREALARAISPTTYHGRPSAISVRRSEMAADRVLALLNGETR